MSVLRGGLPRACSFSPPTCISCVVAVRVPSCLPHGQRLRNDLPGSSPIVVLKRERVCTTNGQVSAAWESSCTPIANARTGVRAACYLSACRNGVATAGLHGHSVSPLQTASLLRGALLNTTGSSRARACVFSPRAPLRISLPYRLRYRSR